MRHTGPRRQRRRWAAVNAASLVASAALALVGPAVGHGTAHALTVSGTVYADRDGDGTFSAGDDPLPGVVVAWETTVFAVTNKVGQYQLDAPSAGIVWVRTPDGFSPAPVWRQVDGTTAVADLPLRPQTATGDLSFVHGSDTHVGVVTAADTARALEQATALEPAPHFLVLTGDLTQSNTGAEFAGLLDALAGVPIPFVPVIGNHDRYDTGTNYRKYLGPPMYGFDAGGLHFVVLDYAIAYHDPQALIDFLERDLAFNTADLPVVAFVHAPLDPSFVDDVEAAGVDYLFTGHWHSNRVIRHPRMVEFNTETMVMGGIDFTPAGYRIARWSGQGFAMTHHTIVERPVLAVTHPRPGPCVPPGDLELVVALETGGDVRSVLAYVDGLPRPLVYRGGWTYTASVEGLVPGVHSLFVRVTRAGGDPLVASHDFCVSPEPPTLPGVLPDWPQLQGGPRHLGAAPEPVVPPLRTVWARAAGGHLRGGSPVLGDGRLFVPIVDLADETTGGVIALDARTGNTWWEHRTGASVHNAPAYADGLVVYGASDGVVHAVDAVTGSERWRVDLGEGLAENVSWLYAAPTISDGTVYIGLQRNFVALDLASGAVRWQVDPSPQGAWLGSYSAAGVADGVVLATFSRGVDGLVAWDADDGTELWRLPRPYSTAVNTSPVIADGVAYFGNAETSFFAVDLVSADFRWHKRLDGVGFDWGYGLAATPALAGGQLIVPTQYDHVHALGLEGGAERWRHAGSPSVIHPVHYEAEATAFPASPVVTGDVVWVGGADGLLRALHPVTGGLLWAEDLGAPILSGPVPSECMLFVATWDGTVRAMVSASRGAPQPEGGLACPEAWTPPYVAGQRTGGCGCGVGGRGLGAGEGRFVVAVVLLVFYRHRHRLRRR